MKNAFRYQEGIPYILLDDFLPEEEYEPYKLLTSSSQAGENQHINMRYVEGVGSKSKEDGYYFVNNVFDYGRINNAELFFSHVQPIVSKLEMLSLLRVRFNWTPRTDKIEEHNPHIDHIPKTLTPPHTLVGLYYVNTNNGYTRMGRDLIIESKANRLVIFNGLTPHNSSTATDVDLRCVINFNFIPTD